MPPKTCRLGNRVRLLFT